MARVFLCGGVWSVVVGARVMKEGAAVQLGLS